MSWDPICPEYTQRFQCSPAVFSTECYMFGSFLISLHISDDPNNNINIFITLDTTQLSEMKEVSISLDNIISRMWEQVFENYFVLRKGIRMSTRAVLRDVISILIFGGCSRSGLDHIIPYIWWNVWGRPYITFMARSLKSLNDNQNGFSHRIKLCKKVQLAAE